MNQKKRINRDVKDENFEIMLLEYDHSMFPNKDKVAKPSKSKPNSYLGMKLLKAMKKG